MAKEQTRRSPSSPCGWKRLFAQPPKKMYGRTSVYLCENELEIENFRQILDWQPEWVKVELTSGVLTIVGDRLELVALEKCRLRLRGLVLKTEFSFDQANEVTRWEGRQI